MSISRTGKVVLSFMLGSAVGSVIALLYAPKAGKYLRSDIGRKTNEMLEEGKKFSYDSWNSVQQRAEKGVDNASEYINTKMEKIARTTEKVKEALSSGFRS